MKQKYKLTILLAIVCLIGLFMVFAPGVAKHENIAVVGSSSVQPIAEKLAETYDDAHPQFEITVQGGGSTMGLNSIKKGSAQIGTYSTKLDANKNPNIKQTKIATDAIIIITNKANKLTDLSSEQLKDIFTGKITNWKDVGGEDGNINIVTREDGSGTRDAVEKLVLKGDDFKKDAIVQSSTGSVIKTVQSDPNAIGYASLADIKDDDINKLEVNGVNASEESIKSGDYVLQRPFLFLTNTTPSNSTQEFIDWVLSSEGQQYVRDQGLIPIN